MEDAGKLLLRLTLGVLMLLHGWAKIQGGIGGIEGMLAAKGLPAFAAYGVYVGEVLAPLLLVAGLFTRLSAVVFAFNMVVATGLAHAGDLGKVTEHGGWAVELQALYLLPAVVVALIGPGRLSLDWLWAAKAAHEREGAGER
ncbi:MAG: DoxX family protein [Planctomycetota bacterium]